MRPYWPRILKWAFGDETVARLAGEVLPEFHPCSEEAPSSDVVLSPHQDSRGLISNPYSECLLPMGAGGAAKAFLLRFLYFAGSNPLAIVLRDSKRLLITFSSRNLLTARRTLYNSQNCPTKADVTTKPKYTSGVHWPT